MSLVVSTALPVLTEGSPGAMAEGLRQLSRRPRLHLLYLPCSFVARTSYRTKVQKGKKVFSSILGKNQPLHKNGLSMGQPGKRKPRIGKGKAA